MLQGVVKVIVSALIVVAVSEVSKRTTTIGALLASLPLTSLAMIWLYVETGDTRKVADLAASVFWLVLPSLALFLVLPALVRAGYGFWPALGAACAASLARAAWMSSSTLRR